MQSRKLCFLWCRAALANFRGSGGANCDSGVPYKKEAITNIGRKIIIALAVLFVVVAVAFFIERSRERAGEKIEVSEQVSGETRSVTVYFGTPSAEGFVAETREIATSKSIEQFVKYLIGELIGGPKSSENVPVMPDGAELLQVFWLEETQTLILDFNRAFKENHPGGSAGEHLTLGAILKTLSANLPQVAKVQFLVEGSTLETLAGHYALDEPLDVKSWR